MATALRPIDNTLPIAQERPRKQAKVSVPIRKQPEPLVNDENQASVPENPEATIDYVPSESLEPIPDPDSKIQSLIEGLDSKDWIKLCGSLNDARRFTIHHSDLLFPFLEKVLLVLVKSMKNPRSALCKTSIMTSSDIFNTFGDKLLESSISEPFDHMLFQLLLKACQDKKFVCEEADRALISMVASFEPLSLLQRLKAYVKHFNLRVRAKAMVSISNCVSKMSLEGMKSYGLVSLVEMAADLVNDKLPEARVASRSVLVSVCRAIKESREADESDEAWQDFCHSNLSTIRAQCVLKFTSTA